MNFFRKLAISFCAAILSLVLLGTAWSTVGLKTVHNRSTVKGWFQKTGFYDHIVDIVLEKANEHKNQADQSDQAKIPTDNQQVQAVAKTVLTPAYLQKNVENLLDGTYDWLDGKTANLNFSVDLSGIKQSLATNLGDYVKKRIDSLPVCPAGQGIADFDGFSSDCKPAGANSTEIANKLTNDVSSGDFLKNNVLTANDIKIKQPDGTTVNFDKSTQGKFTKQGYHYGAYAPLLLGLLSVVTALGVVFLSQDHLKGLKRVGIITLIAGLLILLPYLAIRIGSNKFKSKLATDSSITTSQRALISSFTDVVGSDINKILQYFAGGYILGGVGLMVASRLLRKKHEDKPKLEDPNRGEPLNAELREEKKPEVAKPEEKAPAAKKKIEIK